MRIATFIHQGISRLGAVEDSVIAILPETVGDALELIQGGTDTSREVERLISDGGLARVSLQGVRLLPPLPRLRRDILCTGWNYWDHFEESMGRREGQDVPRPEAPTFFTKGPDVVIGPHDDISFDFRISAKWDYEAEIALVIGKDGRSIPEANALDHVWGYCLANDVSQRDLQRRHGGQWLKGKSIDGTMPLGPWLVTKNELDLSRVRLRCLVNGEVRQDAFATQMAFTVPQLIAELSFGMTLRAGDLLLTGTPAGIGNARTPPTYLLNGDEVIVTATGLGELRNRVVTTDLYNESSVPSMELRP